MADRSNREIIIVEDSQTQAEELRYTLETHGYRVQAARNGQEALELVRRRRPYAVVTDIVMPEMDGFRLCSKIKTEIAEEIPVILLTSLSDPEDVLKGLECGADTFITKPYDSDYLLERIRHVCTYLESGDQAEQQPGEEVVFKERKYRINSPRQKILGLLLATYETAIRKNRELTEAQLKLREWKDRLEETVAERTAALVSEIEERKIAEQEVQRLNRELERRVAERTAELEATNRELETFVYSVSHDLRAPLRAIGGFSHLLEERNGAALDEPSQDYLRRIRVAADNMSSLIEALLRLSKIGREDITPSRVDLSAMVRDTAAELAASSPDRVVDFVIAEGITVRGDRAMLKAVIDNLLGNAWKFTRKTAKATIEFGTGTKDDKTYYRIRDNGVGFDMKLVSRMFAPFQRLHSSPDFPGQGVGLATVQRIIQRHGGSIWAESAVGKGASFYFTLDTPV